jgi:ribosome-associated heat shock protein Hsp15
MDADVRLDKWLQVARVYKTRTDAGKACELGRVSVNGQVAKASRQLKVGDTVETQVGDWKRKLVVKVLRDKPVAKAEAPLLFEDLSGPRPVMDAAERAMRRAPVLRDKGAGRPTKKDRRDLRKALFEPEA